MTTLMTLTAHTPVYLTLAKDQHRPTEEVITCITIDRAAAEEVASYAEPGESRVATLKEAHDEKGDAKLEAMIAAHYEGEEFDDEPEPEPEDEDDDEPYEDDAGAYGLSPAERNPSMAKGWR